MSHQRSTLPDPWFLITQGADAHGAA